MEVESRLLDGGGRSVELVEGGSQEVELGVEVGNRWLDVRLSNW